MISAIAYNLKNLAKFSGRDGRSAFWPYFLFIVILNILVVLAVSAPTIAAALNAGIDAAGSGSTVEVEAAILERMLELTPVLAWLGIIVSALNMLLLSAAFVRRAHDSGLPGLVLLVPVGLQLLWTFFAVRQLDGLRDTMRAIVEAQAKGEAPKVGSGMIAQDLIGWLAILVVVAIAILKSQPGPNTYGPEPAEF